MAQMSVCHVGSGAVRRPVCGDLKHICASICVMSVYTVYKFVLSARRQSNKMCGLRILDKLPVNIAMCMIHVICLIRTWHRDFDLAVRLVIFVSQTSVDDCMHGVVASFYDFICIFRFQFFPSRCPIPVQHAQSWFLLLSLAVCIGCCNDDLHSPSLRSRILAC